MRSDRQKTHPLQDSSRPRKQDTLKSKSVLNRKLNEKYEKVFGMYHEKLLLFSEMNIIYFSSNLEINIPPTLKKVVGDLDRGNI